jgi:hypothetical protein
MFLLLSIPLMGSAQTWEDLSGSTGTIANLNGVKFVNPTEGWIAGTAGTILHTTNRGNSWTPQTSGTIEDLTRLAFITSTRGWVVGANGTILRTIDGGTTWTPQTSPTVQNLLGIDYPPLPPNGTNIWAVGNSGTLVRYSDSALSVNLSAFDAIVSNDRVLLRWKTESEINNLGFNVYRSTQLDGDYVKVTPTFIAGAGTAGTPHEYSFTDEDVVVGNTYYYYITDMDFSGNTSKSDIIKVIVVDKQTKSISIIPRKFALLQNFPNPFNPETWIPYQIARDASVKVQIYNLKGQSIRTIELGQQAAGTYLTKNEAVYWDGRDDSGEKVASGMYFYTLQAGEFKATKRMVIVE